MKTTPTFNEYELQFIAQALSAYAADLSRLKPDSFSPAVMNIFKHDQKIAERIAKEINDFFASEAGSAFSAAEAEENNDESYLDNDNPYVYSVDEV